MSFVSLRELRTSTAKISNMLSDDGKIIVTSNGKPKAIMLHVTESNFEDTLAAINQVKLMRTISNIRIAAQRSGASKMTLDEINEEIRAARIDRRMRADND